ncbi:MAG: DUF3854 domain-containing protein [Thermomicrobiales bacterium]
MIPGLAADLQHLAEQHREKLHASAVAPAIAMERGYRSMTVRAELRRLGFTENQARVPALLLPVWTVGGEIGNYQLRPDEPRVNQRGKPVKYELPAQSQMLLDAHPHIQPMLGDPAMPLWITEGIPKADAATSAGLCCIALLGVWNWRGTNGLGGSTALGDWEAVALKGRRVYVAFDSDVMTKRQVFAALERLGALLTSRGAHVEYVYLPSATGGRKVGLDDYLAEGHTVDDLLNLAEPVLRRPPREGAAAETGPYVATPQGIVYRKPTQNGDIDQPLCNFTAHIIEELIADDGVSERRDLRILGTLADGSPLSAVTVPLARFPAMDWPVREWGTRTIVVAGMGTKDRLREAIQRLSPDVTRRRVYEHPGWREIAENDWVFLHAGGAIGADGPVAGLDVSLYGSAARIRLPDPPTGSELHAAIRASLDLLELAPDPLMAPLVAGVYRAVLCQILPADLSLFLVGPSGVYKSELAALAMQHVGAGFDRLHLPAQWSATANYLERSAFDFKDVPLVIDDFAPTGSQIDIARLHATADRVLRGVGNRGGRGRMHADGTLRPDYPPRGLVIGTGEDAPKGHSVRARTLILEVAPGDVDRDRLTTAQAAGRDGLLVAGLAGYIQWLAARLPELQREAPAQLEVLRTRARNHGNHARTPDAVAQMALGWSLFLRFAAEGGAISMHDAGELFARGWAALGATASHQKQHQVSEEPARHFIELLSSAIAGGYAHVASAEGTFPSASASWGWRHVTIGTGDNQRTDWQPQGARAGWIDGDNLYLDLGAALTAVQRVGQAIGSPITVTSKTLAKRLAERGFLRSTDQAQGEVQVRRTLQGQRRRVLHLVASTIVLEEAGQSGQSGQAASESASSRGDQADAGRISWPDSDETAPESGQEIRPQNATFSTIGRNGRIGRMAETGHPGAESSHGEGGNEALDGDDEIIEWSA